MQVLRLSEGKGLNDEGPVSMGTNRMNEKGNNARQACRGIRLSRQSVSNSPREMPVLKLIVGPKKKS